MTQPLYLCGWYLVEESVACRIICLHKRFVLVSHYLVLIGGNARHVVYDVPSELLYSIALPPGLGWLLVMLYMFYGGASLLCLPLSSAQ